jgi:hypothetical protein
MDPSTVVAMHWQLRFVYNSVSNYCVLQAVLGFYAYLWRYLYELGNSVGNVPHISRGIASCTLAKWENSCVVSAVTVDQNGSSPLVRAYKQCDAGAVSCRTTSEAAPSVQPSESFVPKWYYYGYTDGLRSCGGVTIRTVEFARNEWAVYFCY